MPWIHSRLLRATIAVHDLIMVWIAWTMVYWLRYSLVSDAPEMIWLPREVLVVLGIQGVVLFLSGLYRGLWRFASLPDLWNIVRAAVIGTLLISLALFFFSRLEGVPRSVFLTYPVVLVILLGGPRLIYRIWKDHRLEFNARPGKSERILILGAGRTGDTLARDLRREGLYYPVGFLDDDPQLVGRKLRDIPVLGRIDQLDRIARSRAVNVVVIAMPSATAEQMRRVVEICESAEVEFRTVPRLEDVVSGRYGLAALKTVAIEDLLGREPVMLDWDSIVENLAGKRVLVSGGGGSIGSELCRQIGRLQPARLAIIEQSEFFLYEMERELRQTFPTLALDLILGDVCDRVLVDQTLGRVRPEIIFHAAAYKHVPLLQNQERSAVRNNLLGTVEMARAAVNHAVERFVLISTDKAVNPANIMGATKRAAEIFCESLAGAGTQFLTVRFGNVLDSAGSVVPLFREQIAAGGPLTVTHPDMTRFFMTIPEACQLILQTAAMGSDGQIYVLEMGRAIKIADLAQQMIRLAGKEPGEDIEIVYSGVRGGEKIHEELFHENEEAISTAHPQIRRARHRKLDPTRFSQLLTALETAVSNGNNELVLTCLASMVPEFEIELLSDASADPADILSTHEAESAERAESTRATRAS